MKYCSNCDIAHEEMNCPLCKANEEISTLESDIGERDSKIEELVLENLKLDEEIESRKQN
ncbi:MAG: hypothetical protein WC223_13140 [Bacteroidales bacterium]|jgi:hypothetical protein